MNWRLAFSTKKFNFLLASGVILLIIILAIFPNFLNKMENRNGKLLNDFIINLIPAKDCSIAIFSIIWVCAILSTWQFLKSPRLFLIFLWSYVLLFLSRYLSISLVALNPPSDLIELKDPLTNAFYGGKFITKDLFFSGHTSTIFLMYLVVEKKWLKNLILLGSIAIGVMVLVQHVHYTIDVVAAPFFTYLVYKLGKKISEVKA